jgi:putative FmdB family regulatory protein
MPIYEYRCTACGQVTDILHGIYDPTPTFCPACGEEGTLKKAFAAPAIHFKGTGWAKKDRSASTAPGKRSTDTSRDEGKPAAESGDAGGTTATGEQGSSKTDTKPEKPSTPKATSSKPAE